SAAGKVAAPVGDRYVNPSAVTIRSRVVPNALPTAPASPVTVTSSLLGAMLATVSPAAVAHATTPLGSGANDAANWGEVSGAAAPRSIAATMLASPARLRNGSTSVTDTGPVTGPASRDPATRSEASPGTGAVAGVATACAAGMPNAAARVVAATSVEPTPNERHSGRTCMG